MIEEEDADEMYDHYPHHNPEYHENHENQEYHHFDEEEYYPEQNMIEQYDDEYSINESEMLREQIAAQEAGLAPRPDVDLDYEDDYCDMESIPHDQNSSQYSSYC